MVNNPMGVMTVYFFRYFDFKGPKSWKNYAWIVGATTDCDLRLNHASDQKVEKNRPPFFWKNRGQFSSTFLSEAWFGLQSWSVVARLFKTLFYHDLCPLKSKYLKNYKVITLSGFWVILAFKIWVAWNQNIWKKL